MPDGIRVAFHVIVSDDVRLVDCQPQSLVAFRKYVSTNTPRYMIVRRNDLGTHMLKYW